MTRIVRGSEWLLYASLYLCVAFSPLASNLLLRQIPGAISPLGTVGFSAASISWAFLVYFAWAYLPLMSEPNEVRRKEWAVFLALELAYPMLCWGVEREARLYLVADILTYASTCITLATSVLLYMAWASQLESGSEAWGNLPVLVICFFFISVPGLLGEVSWWVQVEAHGDLLLGPVPRVLGLVLGTVGVVRNLLAAALY